MKYKNGEFAPEALIWPALRLVWHFAAFCQLLEWGSWLL